MTGRSQKSGAAGDRLATRRRPSVSFALELEGEELEAIEAGASVLAASGSLVRPVTATVGETAASSRRAVAEMVAKRVWHRRDVDRAFLREALWVLAHCVRWCEARADQGEVFDADQWRAALDRARTLRTCGVCGRRRGRRARGAVCRESSGCCDRVLARARTAAGV